MSLIKNRLISHRGLHKKREIPENSLAAFKEAVKNGYSMEFDINITNDSKIVVFHDDDLNRLCGVDKKIEEVSSSFLKSLNLYETNEKIPLLEDVLKEVDGKSELIIEIKKHQNIGILENLLIELLKNYKGSFLICSFDQNILNWFKTNKVTLKRGLIFESLPLKFKKYEKFIFLYKYFKSKPDFISLDYKLLESSIFHFCKANKIPTIIWTVNSQVLFEKYYDEVDAIIFENIVV